MRYRERLGQMKAFVLESIYGLKDIQIFGAGNRRMEQVTQRGQAINRAAHGLTLHQQAVSSVPTFFVYLARISIVAVASYLALAGTGDPVAAILLSYVATASFSSTQSSPPWSPAYWRPTPQRERLFLLEDTPPEVQEADHPRTVGPIREIVFDHVTFQYSPEGKAILDDFQLTVHSQEKLGIVGESGMGKSTILRLLLRFWNPTGGEIRINGIPLQQISLAELRQASPYWSRTPFFSTGPLPKTLPWESPTPLERKLAGQPSGLGSMTLSRPSPLGYETPMGQMSACLSGGERRASALPAPCSWTQTSW